MENGKMVRMIKIVSSIFIFSLLCTACTTNQSINQARKLWESVGNNNYHLIIRHVQSIWHCQDITIEVLGDEITHSAICIPAPAEGDSCKIESYDPNNYTIEGLFKTAESKLNGEYAKWVTVEFHPEFGYPTLITYNHPDMLDEDEAWMVIDFSFLE